MKNLLLSQRNRLSLVLLLVMLGHLATAGAQKTLAPTPPMGWNSWDSYGTTVTEQDIRANADWMHAHLQQFGWQYIIVDMEWFVTNPTASGNSREAHRVLDAHGRYIPAVGRFPSSADGKGFAPLAAYVHSLGLKFGIHILQGIPRQALVTDPVIEGSTLRMLDAADTDGTCNWNPDNFDLKHTGAGQAYYDSIARLYASWGVDLIKVDCITAPRFKGEEIAMLRKALDHSGRSISLSLSPGEPPIEPFQSPDLVASVQQWRISNDIWDVWHSDQQYPQGVGDQFARVAYWNHTREPGHWPDADMLPLGYLGPAPGWGKPRECRLTHAEQRTLVTLWSIFRSPLMMGGNLPRTDAWTESLLTNPEVIDMDQHSTHNRLALQRLDSSVWTATSADGTSNFVAVFNQSDKPLAFKAEWAELGMAGRSYRLHNMWEHTDTAPQTSLHMQIEPHGSVLLRASVP
jgi:alpha-galactosidase